MSPAVQLGAVAALVGAHVADMDAEVVVSSVELNASHVEPGALFAALPGRRVHGASFARQAAEEGAVALLTDAAGVALAVDAGLPIITVDDPRAVLGSVSALVYGTTPDDLAGMLLFGVTGTNGKTTVNAMLEAGLRETGRLTALVGTTGTVIAGEHIATVRTTPEAPHVHALLRRMLDAGVQAACFEVSSIALREHRIDDVVFNVVGFTNLTQDHLDYHGTMEEYFLAKAELFTPEHARAAVIGVDDAYGRRLSTMATVPTHTWSLDDTSAAWHRSGSTAKGPNAVVELRTQLPGTHNSANALLALAMLVEAGVDAVQAARGIANAVVPGRMEVVGLVPTRGIVDYAHSPDAIERVLAALRSSTAGRLIVVLGAGGDRDQSKRALMGAAAARLADVVIVTDDNPRSEDPAEIRAAVLAGAGLEQRSTEILEVGDRASAISTAVRDAGPDDTVVVLGKGHETGQEIAGVIHPFDDRSVLAAAMEQARS